MKNVKYEGVYVKTTASLTQISYLSFPEATSFTVCVCVFLPKKAYPLPCDAK